MKSKLVLLVFGVLLTGILNAQDKKGYSIPLIGGDAPAFTAESTNGQINFPGDFGRSWKILFSHPLDFTPVCTSEILQLSHMQKEFDALNTKIAVVSTDTKLRHQMWKSSMEETSFNDKAPTAIKFPLFEDANHSISRAYGMLHSPVSTTKDVRGVFVIDPTNVVRAIYFYPMEVGRNMDEVVRTVKALQTADKTALATPVNWIPGGDLLVPHFPYTQDELVSNPELKNKYYNVGNFLFYQKSSGK